MTNMRILSDKRGLTLVELMIVLVLSLLLMAAVYMTYQLQHSTGESQFQVTSTQQDLRAAMEIISADIMNSGCNPRLMINFQGITSGSSGPSDLELVMDLNGNGTTTIASTDINEHVTYRNQNGQLIRRDINNGNQDQILANNVTQLAFTYFDSQHNVIVPGDPIGNLLAAQAETVKFIQVDLGKNSDNVDPQTNQRIQRHLQRTVCRRNG